jgi:hypothetical protein
MKIKMIKFSLPLDGKSCKTQEDIAHNFNLPELIEHYKSGRLLLWCRVRKLEKVIEVLESITEKNNHRKIAEKLCEIFEVDTNDLVESVMVYEYIDDAFSLSSQERVKAIFKQYKDEYLEVMRRKEVLEKEKKEAIKAEILKKEKAEKENIILSKIKCVKYEYPNSYILKEKKFIPLYVHYNTDTTYNARRPMLIKSSIKGEVLIVDEVFGNAYLDNIISQIKSTFHKYEYLLFDRLKLEGKIGSELKQSKIRDFHIYVYDINNTINDIDCITNSNTKVISKNIYNTIDREKLLQSANNA